MAPGKPWGTIEKPRMGLGHQKISAEKIDEMVERLSAPKKYSEMGESYNRRTKTDKRPRRLDKERTDAMLKRLANKEVNREKTPDTIRVCPYKKVWGAVLNSYAWHGVNHQAILCNEESP